MFPPTRHSVIAAASSDDSDLRRHAFGRLVEVYWRPVYKYVRLRWHADPDEAEDLTQAFFARTLEKNGFDAFDPVRARFRTFLRTCLDSFVANERKSASRVKRGGAVVILPLEFETAERELAHHDPGVPPDLDDYFDREWRRSVVALAVERFRQRSRQLGRVRPLAVFERYDLQGPDADARPTYADVGRELGLSVFEVTNALTAARRDFRAIVVECLRELTMSEEEFRSESRRLGIEPS